ncbi:MAG: DUF5696 domain-containing protein [Acetatifactor sp.]
MKKENNRRNAERKAAVLKQLKSLIFPLILCAIIVAGIIVVLNYKNKEEEEQIIPIYGYDGTDQPIVMDNGKLKLTMDPMTTQFSVEVKETGDVWYSNPQNMETDATAAGENEKNSLQSTVLMSYSMVTGDKITYNSFKHSVTNGIYEIETGDNFIKVKYSMGIVERQYVVPPVCTQENFEKWLELMEPSDKSMIKGYYKLYDINNLKKGDDKEALLASYPSLETEKLYILRSNASGAVKETMEKVFEKIGYTLEDYEADKDLDASESSSNKPVFDISVIYRLDGEELVVEVPMSELLYKTATPIYTLSVLPYFGAGGKSDDGFILVPEGGGAIINFNNGRTAQSNYLANLYGWDMAMVRDEVVHETRAYFNAFGISREDSSFLCILEEGAPYAAIKADVSGKKDNTSYNYVNALYTVSPREEYKVGDIADSKVFVYLEDLPDETLTQRYRFVDGGDYTDMAKSYQAYLKEKYGSYLTKNEETKAPAVIQILGAVDKVKQIVGVPVSKPLELTTFKEAEELINELSQLGVENMTVKMLGWCNGGVNQKILKKVKPLSELGGKNKLKSMIDNANSIGVDVYLEGVTQYEYDSDIFDGFFSYRDAAKFISKERAELYIYSDVTFAAREGADSYYLLHTDLAFEMAENLAEFASKYGTGVAFRDTGKDLSADYYKKNFNSRQAVLYRQAEYLKKLRDAGQNVMINMGNDFAAPYSNIITDMDLRGSQYTLLNEFVPFYQMAIHGYVDYTGEPINLAGNAEEELLLSAEYGAGLSFTFMKESSFALQKTLYTEYYGAEYDAWRDKALEIYKRYNAELGHTFNQEMTGHEILAEKLTCTIYEDGTKVYVNYATEDAVTPDGIKVPARDYKVVR